MTQEPSGLMCRVEERRVCKVKLGGKRCGLAIISGMGSSQSLSVQFLRACLCLRGRLCSFALGVEHSLWNEDPVQGRTRLGESDLPASAVGSSAISPCFREVYGDPMEKVKSWTVVILHTTSFFA